MSAKRSEKLTESISALLVQQPFFASLLLDLLEIHEAKTLPSGANLGVAATDGKILWINPETFGGFTIHERIGILVHEIMHVILQHSSRARGYMQLGVGPDLSPFSRKKWNHAADYVINAYLTANNFKLPLGSLQNSQITGDDIVDGVYLKLPDMDEDESDGWDQHEPMPDNVEENKPAVQAAVRKAEEIKKMMGKGAGLSERQIGDICEPQITWSEHLRKSIITVTRGSDTYTWAKPNRRRLAVPPHIYWPGRAGHKGPHIAVEIDTSGSISDAELRTFMGELSGILADVNPEMVYVMYVDDKLFNDEVIEIDDVNDLENVAKKSGGGGGTDMTVVFEVIKERELPAETVIILTDGYTPWGEDSGIPTIWCITSESVIAPWGTTVHVKIGGK